MKKQQTEELPPPERLVSGTYSVISQLTDPTSLVEPVPVAVVASPASSATTFRSERISLDDLEEDDDFMDEKAAAMPPPLQRNVSIHEQKGLLLQQCPGAVSIVGSSETGNTEPSPRSEQLDESDNDNDDQEQPSYEASYTTTAIAISNEDLESEIRGRILQNAVQASHIQAEKPGHQKRNLGMVVCIAVAAILAAILVTRLLLIHPKKDESIAVPTFSPQPTSAPSTPLPTQHPTLLPTFSPTAAPTTDRNRILAEYLRPLTFDQGESMDRPGSPQSNAFRTVVARRTLYPGEDLVTTYALLVLFESMQGSRWTNSTNWYTGSSVCSWHGVTCKPSSQTQRRRLMQPEVKGDNDGMNVAGLRLSNNQLLGTLPPEVALLPLEVLDLSGNHLVDAIPSQLQHLRQIKFLNLQGNADLYGAIPESLCTDGVILQVDCATVTCSCCVPDCLLMAPAAAPVAAGPVADMIPSLVTSPSLLTTPTTAEAPYFTPSAIAVPTYTFPTSPVATPVLSPLAAPLPAAVPTIPTSQSLPTVATVPSVPTLPTAQTLPTTPSIPTAQALPTTPSIPTAQTLPSVPTTPTTPSLPTSPSLPTLPTEAQPTLPTSPVLLPIPMTPSAPQVASTRAPVTIPTARTPAPTGRLNSPVETPVLSPVVNPAPSPILITNPEDGFPAPTQVPVLQPVPKPVGYPPTIIPPFSVPAQLPVYAPNAPPAIAPSIPTIPSILQQPILQPTLNLVPSQIAILAPLLPPNLKPALPKVEWSPVRPPASQAIPVYVPAPVSAVPESPFASQPAPVSAVPESPFASQPAPVSAVPESPFASQPAPVSAVPSSIPLSPLSSVPEGAPSLIEAPAPVEGPTDSSVPNPSSSILAPVSSNIEDTPIEEESAFPSV